MTSSPSYLIIQKYAMLYGYWHWALSIGVSTYVFKCRYHNISHKTSTADWNCHTPHAWQVVWRVQRDISITPQGTLLPIPWFYWLVSFYNSKEEAVVFFLPGTTWENIGCLSNIVLGGKDSTSTEITSNGQTWWENLDKGCGELACVLWARPIPNIAVGNKSYWL